MLLFLLGGLTGTVVALVIWGMQDWLGIRAECAEKAKVVNDTHISDDFQKIVENFDSDIEHPYENH